MPPHRLSHPYLVLCLTLFGCVSSEVDANRVANNQSRLQVALLTGPLQYTASTEATFEFLADDPNAQFLCALDDSEPLDCTSPFTLRNLAEGVHTFSVASVGSAVNTPAATASTAWQIDLTPPTSPSNVNAVASGMSQINLSWNAADDTGGSGVVLYRVYRDNGTQVAELPDTTFSESGLNPGTTYRYNVTSVDLVAHESLLSSLVSATTVGAPDTTAPLMPTGLSGLALSSSAIRLNWNATTDSGGSGLAGYRVFRYNNSSFVPIGTSMTTTYDDSGLAAGTTHYYLLTAYDNAGNESGQTSYIAVTTNVATDSTPPSAVTLSMTSVTSNSVTLSWTAPGDDGNSGTAATYDLRYATSAITESSWSSALLVSGEPTPAVAGTMQSKMVSGLNASTTYFFALKTSDEVPNVSMISNSPSATTTGSAFTPIRLDFNNSTNPNATASGYTGFVNDSTMGFNSTRKYGYTDSSYLNASTAGISGRSRSEGTDLTRDYHRASDSTGANQIYFRLDVPNGRYTVLIHRGDLGASVGACGSHSTFGNPMKVEERDNSSSTTSFQLPAVDCSVASNSGSFDVFDGQLNLKLSNVGCSFVPNGYCNWGVNVLEVTQTVAY